MPRPSTPPVSVGLGLHLLGRIVVWVVRHGNGDRAGVIVLVGAERLADPAARGRPEHRARGGAARSADAADDGSRHGPDLVADVALRIGIGLVGSGQRVHTRPRLGASGDKAPQTGTFDATP